MATIKTKQRKFNHESPSFIESLGCTKQEVEKILGIINEDKAKRKMTIPNPASPSRDMEIAVKQCGNDTNLLMAVAWNIAGHHIDRMRDPFAALRKIVDAKIAEFEASKPTARKKGKKK